MISRQQIRERALDPTYKSMLNDIIQQKFSKKSSDWPAACPPVTSAAERLSVCHNDVIKWQHFPRYWPFVLGTHRSPVHSPHKGRWRGALMFSVICQQKDTCTILGNFRLGNRTVMDIMCRHMFVFVLTKTQGSYWRKLSTRGCKQPIA